MDERRFARRGKCGASASESAFERSLENVPSPSEVALDALEIVKGAVVALKSAPTASNADFVKYACAVWKGLYERGLPDDLLASAEAIVEAVINNAQEARALIEEKIAEEKARFEEALATEKERLRSESDRKRTEKKATLGKILITLVCIAAGLVLAFKGAAFFTCAMVYVVLYVWGEKEPLMASLNALAKKDADKED